MQRGMLMPMSNDEPRRKVTLADVARQSGVSPAAASLAIRGEPGVSRETRDRVLATARRIGYRGVSKPSPRRLQTVPAPAQVGHGALVRGRAWPVPGIRLGVRTLWQFAGPFGIVGHRRTGGRFELRAGYLVDVNLLELLLTGRLARGPSGRKTRTTLVPRPATGSAVVCPRHGAPRTAGDRLRE